MLVYRKYECVVMQMLYVWAEQLQLEVVCLIHRVLSYTECACCAYDPSVHLSVPSICFVYTFVCRKLSPHLRV